MSEAAPSPGRGRPRPRTATPRQRLMLTLGALGVLLLVFWIFSPILTPFVLAIVLAYFLDPVAARLARIGVPRGLAAGLLVLMILAAGLLAALLLYPLVIAQIGVLLTRLPGYIATIGQALRDFMISLEAQAGPEVVDTRLRELVIGQAGAMLGWLGTAATRLIGGGFALFNVFTLAIVTPVVAFYFLRDWPRMISRIDSWLPRRSAATLRQLARDMDRVLSAWLRGQLLCCLLLGAFYAMTLSAIGLELGLMVGLLAGLLSFIPYVGSFTGFAIAVLLAIGQWGTTGAALLVTAIFAVGHTVEGYVIYPRLLGDRVELHAVWVIFALFAGGVAFGFLGVLLAVPLAAALGVLARFWLRRYLESPLYLDPPRP
ncbi:AI-2E family transporter [Sabulicella glaciei]|uniref:AI-2E family transporter n=1 Tax=Sabulicella glaciei TaxID=2984948 RepID=A0ABT3NR82_9PROT|nr:AI-2E family transporter [Roseococcus sp. MDT2-1-1]MCW8084099.1 AI-2E family transporter [Roseococcus sp. MDT2-1-1]